MIKTDLGLTVKLVNSEEVMTINAEQWLSNLFCDFGTVFSMIFCEYRLHVMKHLYCIHAIFISFMYRLYKLY